MGEIKAGRNTRGTWVILQWILCTATFLIIVLCVFIGNFGSERTDILFARQAIAKGPDLTSQQSIDLYEYWQTLAAKSIFVVAVKWVFLSLLLGLLMAFVVWLLIICVMFAWWFVLDRIRDLSAAIKNQMNN